MFLRSRRRRLAGLKVLLREAYLQRRCKIVGCSLFLAASQSDEQGPRSEWSGRSWSAFSRTMLAEDFFPAHNVLVLVLAWAVVTSAACWQCESSSHDICPTKKPAPTRPNLVESKSLITCSHRHTTFWATRQAAYADSRGTQSKTSSNYNT